jgi:hypothetical protein
MTASIASTVRRAGSVQATHFRIETIERIAVHVLPVAEQEAILAGYASFLNALSFPTQLLVRIQRRSLELHIRSVREAAAEFGRRPETAALAHVADGYIEYLTGLHEHATLLDRRCYIVVPADPRVVHAALPAAPSRRQRLMSLFSRGRPDEGDEDEHETDDEEEAARLRQHDPRDAIFSHLQFRCDQVIRLLARSGMPAWRITGPALHQLIYSCWNPEQARLYPLQEEHLAFHTKDDPRRSLVAQQDLRQRSPGRPATGAETAVTVPAPAGQGQRRTA